MSLTAEETAKAKEIVNQLVWQPVEGHNYRYTRAVNTLTRFCEAASMEPDVAKLVIAYLKEEVVSDGISLLNKRMDFGAGWKAMDAWYQTAASERFAGTESTKVRIFQVLMQPPADGDPGDGPYLLEDGCQYKISHTFFWNVEVLPELDESSSGIQYTMQGITRDSTTGLYSCVIEKRERVKQDVPLYDTAMTIFEHIQEELHLGVKASDLPTTGQNASVGGGTIVERRVSKNPDCTSDVQNKVTVEDPVSESVKQYRKTLRGTVETTTDRNQTTPLGGSSMKVGETRRSEKTPGGLYNNTTEAVTTEAAGEIAKDCQNTIFEHTDETLTNQLAEPASKEASAAGSGKTYRKTTRKNEAGTFDVTERETTENPVSESVKQYRKTLRGTVETTVDRNQTTPLNDGTGTGGTPMKVGETRRSEKTPGGLYNNTTEAVTTEAAGEVAKDCQKTIFEHTDETLTNQLEEPASKEASAAGSGKTYRKTTRKNEEGSFDVTERETTENPVSESVKQYRKTLRGTVETTVDRNQTTPLNDGTGTGGTPMKVGETRRSEKTPGGLYNNTTEAVTIDTNVQKIANGCQKTSSVHTDTKVESVPVEQAEDEHVTEEVNKEKEVSYRRNDDGATKDKTTVTRTWALEEKTKTWSDSNYDYTYHTYRNATEPVVPAEGEIVSVSFAHNGHGSFDGSYLVKTSKTAEGGSALQWTIGPKDITAKYYYFNKAGKLCHRLFSGTLKKVYGKSKFVANELYGPGVTPAYVPQVGWVTHMDNGHFTHGTLYTLTSVGAEVVDDSDGQAQS